MSSEGRGPEGQAARELEGMRSFAEREDIVGFVEVEAANATGVDPDEKDVFADPELVRAGLRSVLRSVMSHLGREETDRQYERAFGVPPSGKVNPARLPTLRELRDRKGFGKREFARMTGSSTRALQDAEGGERAPRPETMRKYAEALGVRPWEIREFARWLLGEGDRGEVIDGIDDSGTRSRKVQASGKGD